MALSIFVSSHRDAGLVKPVVGLLRATKDLVFQDVTEIRPGKKWRPQIRKRWVSQISLFYSGAATPHALERLKTSMS